ncbi:MAG: hypothetical protein HOC94_01450, partial [Waddliaceae bacterium]|nr:hypothetical protein [Waddliaceae bacterium]
HLSEEHEWFQDALAGDIAKLDNFIVTKTAPKYQRRFDEERGYVIDYKEDDGTITSRRLVFPEICESQYRKVTIDDADYYLYHMFYPFQLDVNWKNPNVLYYMLDVVGHWANNGVDIFRFDAIAYFIKEKGHNGENHPKTHDVVKIVNAFVESVAPSSVLLAEACQRPNDILPYFGEERPGSSRTDEVQMAYHFPYMPAVWYALVTGDSSAFWETHNDTPEIPENASWATLLRIHDELSLEMPEAPIRKALYDALSPKGVAFRQGYGIGGRMADFLDNDPRRISQAFAVLLSLPGMPIIYYGDEIGARNNWEYAYASAEVRKKIMDSGDIESLSSFDGRDINRGPIAKEAFYGAKDNNAIYDNIKKLIAARKGSKALTRGECIEARPDDTKAIFSYVRTFEEESVFVVHNLSDETVTTKVSLPQEYIHEGPFYDIATDEEVAIAAENGIVEVTLGPYSSIWTNASNLH